VYSNISITGPLPGTPKAPLKSSPVDKRDNVISEFIRTEETYVRHLKIIEVRGILGRVGGGSWGAVRKEGRPGRGRVVK
jgi:hypothetical protein